MWIKKKNYYDSTEVNHEGGKKYGSDIHAIAIRTNHTIWDMIKVLDSKKLFGFYFTAKISVKKTIIIMHHEDKEVLSMGKEALKEFQDIENILFLAKIKKPKPKKNIVLLIVVLLFIPLILVGGYFLYGHNIELFIEKSLPKKSHKSIGTETIEIDIKALEALQKSFNKQKDPMQESITKTMMATASVVSSMVPESEKEKYSSEALVKNFKGKGGLKFVLKDTNMSNKDFNMSVNGLNEYVSNFIKENNCSEVLNYYNDIIKADKSATKEDLAIANNNKAKLYLEENELDKAEDMFVDSLNISKELEQEAQKGVKTEIKRKIEIEQNRDNPNRYRNYIAYNLKELSHIYRDSNQTELADNKINEALQIYTKVVSIYRKLVKKRPDVFQSRLAWSINMLANFYHEERGDFNKSIKLRDEAVDIYTKLDKSTPNKFTIALFKTVNSLAKSYLFSDRLKIAQQNYQKALKIINKSPNREKNSIYATLEAEVYNNLAWIDIAQKRLDKADEKLQHSLKLAKKGKSSVQLATSNFYLGYISILKNEIEKAIELYLKSYKLDKRYDTAKSYVTLLVEKGKYIKAKDFFELMLKNHKKKREVAEILLMYGKFYMSIDVASADRKLKKSLKLYSEISIEDNSTEYRELMVLLKL